LQKFDASGDASAIKIKMKR
jgi:hypothetical protein